jgi:hypothetical protein
MSCERLMAPHRVDRDAYLFRTIPLEFRTHLVVEDHLVSADGAPVSRLESDDRRFTREVAEGQGLIGRDVQCEFGARVPGAGLTTAMSTPLTVKPLNSGHRAATVLRSTSACSRKRSTKNG